MMCGNSLVFNPFVGRLIPSRLGFNWLRESFTSLRFSRGSLAKAAGIGFYGPAVHAVARPMQPKPEMCFLCLFLQPD
jgi:hypothetical protein